MSKKEALKEFENRIYEGRHKAAVYGTMKII